MGYWFTGLGLGWWYRCLTIEPPTYPGHPFYTMPQHHTSGWGKSTHHCMSAPVTGVLTQAPAAFVLPLCNPATFLHRVGGGGGELCNHSDGGAFRSLCKKYYCPLLPSRVAPYRNSPTVHAFLPNSVVAHRRSPTTHCSHQCGRV